MRAGRLNRYVEIWNPVDTRGVGGEYTRVLTKMISVWASIEDIFSSEQVQASVAVGFTVSHLISMRYNDSLSSESIIKYGAREFSVVSILNPKSSNRELQIMAQEKV